MIWLTCWLLLAALTANAEIQQADTKESLRGLDGVYVVVQMVDAQPEGITTNSLMKLVTAALAEAGIPTNAVPKKFNGDANLTIVVDTLKDTQLDIYEFRIEISVAQDVTMTRDTHSKWIFAETWRRTLQGLTSPDRTDIIEQAVKKCVDIFVADYRAVNPKLPAKTA